MTSLFVKEFGYKPWNLGCRNLLQPPLLSTHFNIRPTLIFIRTKHIIIDLCGKMDGILGHIMYTFTIYNPFLQAQKKLYYFSFGLIGHPDKGTYNRNEKTNIPTLSSSLSYFLYFVLN